MFKTHSFKIRIIQHTFKNSVQLFLCKSCELCQTLTERIRTILLPMLLQRTPQPKSVLNDSEGRDPSLNWPTALLLKQCLSLELKHTVVDFRRTCLRYLCQSYFTCCTDYFCDILLVSLYHFYRVV